MPRNKLIVPAAIVALGIVFAPAAVQAAISGTVTATGTGSATCPTGYRVSGGGYELPADYYAYNSSIHRAYKARYSRPYGSNKWQASATFFYDNNGSGYEQQSTYAPKVYALCVK